ncbi:MAG TPA: hypothetical protein VKC66_27685 [Xanthobacteraceae bacterium]|nr:hypothetical protein [Xanthobacteraceae bacterium]
MPLSLNRMFRHPFVELDGPHAMVRLLARVIGVGIETADMLVQEVLSRNSKSNKETGKKERRIP